METSGQKGKEDKYELKEFIDKNQFKSLLREWLNAMEEDTDLQVKVKGTDCTVPKEAFSIGRFRSEFEIDEGEYEFELQLKWKNTDSSEKSIQ